MLNLFTRRRELERAIPNLVKAIPLLLLGCHGAGKSWAIRHIAQSLSQPIMGRRIVDLDIRLFPRHPNSGHRHLCQWLMHEICQRLGIPPDLTDYTRTWEGADETTSMIAIRELASRFSGGELYLLLDNADSIVQKTFAETAGHFYRQMAGWKQQFEEKKKKLCIALASTRDPEHIESIIGLSIFHGAHRCMLRDFSLEQIIGTAGACGVALSDKQARTVLRLTGGRPAHVAGVIGDVLAGDVQLKPNLRPDAVPFFVNTLRPHLSAILREPPIRQALRNIDAGNIGGTDVETIHTLEVEGLVRSTASALELTSEFVRVMK